MLNFEKITVTEDNYLAIYLKDNVQIDNYQFSTVNSNGNYFINCIKDRYNENCLLYYVEELTTLREFIKKTSFDFLSFRELILNIAKVPLWLQEKKLMTSNIVWDLEHIFIDRYTNDVRFIYIPAIDDSAVSESNSSFQSVLKDLVNNSNCSNCDDLIGFVLSNSNSSKLDISDFHKRIKIFKRLDMKNKKMDSGIITMLSTLFFCIVVPTIGNLLNITFIVKNINLSAIVVFSLLFVIASMVAIIMNRLRLNNKEKMVIEKNIIKPNNIKQNIVNQDDSISKSCELNLTNIKPGFSGLNTGENLTNRVSFGKKEYNPIMASAQAAEDRNNDEKHINLTTAENVTSSGTQVLFNEDNGHTAYIIKKGTSSLVDRVYIDNIEFIISRNKNNSSFAIEENSISKRHATIKLIESEYFIVDNSSSNGTFLNDIKLQPNKEYNLKNGDSLAFAKQQFEFFDR